jgi:orotate phosphoribosyltransferase-like protein
MKHSQSGHFVNILPRKRADLTIRESVALCSKLEFDTFAFSGLSGACLAPILAHLMHKELLMVRKNGGKDGSTSGMWREGYLASDRLIIVDDLISSGATMANMLHAFHGIRKLTSGGKLEIVGLLLHTHLSTVSWQYGPHLYEPGQYEFNQMIETQERYKPKNK